MRLVLILLASALVVTIGVAVFVPTNVDSANSTISNEIERGAKVFRRCQACHSLSENKKLSGPSLAGVINRPSASLSGYRYSPAMARRQVIWDKTTITQFLTKPREFVPGTKMGFAGIRDAQEIADLLAFLTERGGVYTAPNQ